MKKILIYFIASGIILGVGLTMIAYTFILSNGLQLNITRGQINLIPNQNNNYEIEYHYRFDNRTKYKLDSIKVKICILDKDKKVLYTENRTNIGDLSFNFIYELHISQGKPSNVTIEIINYKLKNEGDFFLGAIVLVLGVVLLIYSKNQFHIYNINLLSKDKQ